MKLTSRLIPIGVAGALALTACGGGDNAREVLSGGGTTDETTSPTTDAPAESVPDTEPVATAPVATDAPTDEGTNVPASGGDLDAFCGASSQFYVESRGLDSIATDDDDAARVLFARMELSVSASLLNAPDEQTATAPRRVEELFTVLLPALDALDYDFEGLENLDNAEEVATSFTEFGEIVDGLESFLVDTCDADTAALDARADVLASEVSTQTVSTEPETTEPETTEPETTEVPPVDVPTTDVGDDGEEFGDVKEIADDSGQLTSAVPTAWTEVRGTPDGELRQLVASADIPTFLATFSEPGIFLASGDAPSLNGAEAGAGAMTGFEAAVEAQGCVRTADVPYDDGLYTGDERAYSCPGTTSVTRLASGTNETGDLYWLLAVVHAEGDDAVWTTITESFLVD